MKQHIKILDLLRGLAALSVVFYHFNTTALRPNALTDIIFYGQFGVHVFFVISGFIIPYSMFWNNYVITDFFKNLLRRYIRIDPPSYVAILLIVILYYSAIIIVKRPINGMEWPGINFTSIIGNLTYTVPYLKTAWFNSVFWTLAIEFQFYILIGLFLPIIMKKNNILTFLSLIIMMILGNIYFLWFFRYATFFVLGMLIFMYREMLLDRKLILITSIAALIFCFHQNNLAEFILGTSTFILIFSGKNFHFRITTFLGKISYSLYITHLFVGYVLEIITKRIIDVQQFGNGKLIFLFVYVGIAIVFAYVFYLLVEKPFLQYSKRIKFSHPPKKLETAL